MKHLLDTKVGPYQAMIPMVDVDTIGGAVARSPTSTRAASSALVRALLGRIQAQPPTVEEAPNRRQRCDGQSRLALARGFLGGDMALQPDLARQAFEEGPAKALEMSVEEASMGAIQILTHSMVQSIEENSVRKGFDPRDFALVAEGGAGPMFAAQIALEVGTPHVIVPPTRA